jgi:predicted HTH domain antitoxin
MRESTDSQPRKRVVWQMQSRRGSTQHSKDSLISSVTCGIVASMSTVQVELPEELFALANVSGTPSRSASKLIALELFRERLVSAGKAAELAGISIEEFLDFSARREVPMHYTEAEWEQDQTVADKLKL